VLVAQGRPQTPAAFREKILGRDVDGAIDLDSPSVIRRHARIIVSDHDATIEDLESKTARMCAVSACRPPCPYPTVMKLRVGSVNRDFASRPGQVRR
jgi:hypothetical protein